MKQQEDLRNSKIETLHFFNFTQDASSRENIKENFRQTKVEIWRRLWSTTFWHYVLILCFKSQSRINSFLNYAVQTYLYELYTFPEGNGIYPFGQMQNIGPRKGLLMIWTLQLGLINLCRSELWAKFRQRAPFCFDPSLILYHL